VAERPQFHPERLAWCARHGHYMPVAVVHEQQVAAVFVARDEEQRAWLLDKLCDVGEPVVLPEVAQTDG
jgi:hypothetical protein